ncbi:MAG TPA: zinc-ribbon domain-containing protein [Actinomycetota bacterium]|nr:zinc-ribbon domain-containing protein [Actinomycetota bacterium]
MIICKNCGYQNEDDDAFCGSCGTFLEWAGERLTEEQEPGPEPESQPEPEPEKAGFMDRVKSTLGIGDEDQPDGQTGTTPQAPPTEQPAAESGAGEGAPETPVVDAEPAAPTGTGPPDTAAERQGASGTAPTVSPSQPAGSPRIEPPRRDVTRPMPAAASTGEAPAASAEDTSVKTAEPELAVVVPEVETPEVTREREEAERKAREEADRKSREEADRKSREEAEAREREQAERRLTEEEARRQRDEAERRSREEAERNAREEAESKVREEEAAKQRQEAEAKARQEFEAKQREEAERKAREEEQRRSQAASEEEQRRTQAASEEERRRSQAASMVASAEAVAKARKEAEARKRAEAEARKRAEEEAQRHREDEEARRLLAEAEEQERTDRAAALVAKPPTAPTPDVAARTPGAQKPAAQREKRARQQVKMEPTRQPKPGDLICGQCGEVNDRDRKFCRRCANTLLAAEVAKKVPWYKRIFGRKPMAAGTRRGRAKAGQKGKTARRGFRQILGMLGKLRMLVAVLALLGLAGGMVIPSARGAILSGVQGAYCAVKIRAFPDFNPVHALRAEAPGQKGHPASLLIDDGNNTHWAESGPGDGTGERISILFNEPVDIAQMIFTTGNQETPQSFAKQPRPAEITMRFINARGRVVATEKETLGDTKAPQPVEVSGAGTKRIDIRIDSVYEGQAGNALSLTEIEFRSKSC